MPSPYLPNDVLNIVASFLREEDDDGYPLLSNLRSFVAVSKQFNICGTPYLYLTYANPSKKERNSSSSVWNHDKHTDRREVTSLWPFARALLGSSNLGRHVRCIIHSRTWEVNNGEELSLAVAGDCPELVFKHFPGLSPHSEDGVRYQGMLDRLSNSSSIVRQRLSEDPMTNPAFGPTCELADFVAVLTHTPNLEELRLSDGGYRWHRDFPPGVTVLPVVFHPWSSVLAEIPHGFAHLRTVELGYRMIRDIDECYQTISYLLTLPSIDFLKFGAGIIGKSPLSRWLCPCRTSSLRSLDLRVGRLKFPSEQERFCTLLFASCKELERLRLRTRGEKGTLRGFLSNIFDSLAMYHHDSLRSLSIEYLPFISGTSVPVPNFSIFPELRHREIGIYHRNGYYRSVESETPDVLKHILPPSLETLLIKQSEKRSMQHVADIVESIRTGSLPNFQWFCVAQRWTPEFHVNPDQQERNGDASAELWDEAYMAKVLDSVNFDWSFNSLWAHFPGFVRWQVEAHSHSADCNDIRKRYSDAFKNWSSEIH